MENSKGSTNVRNLMYCGKHALLPPKIPFPSASPAYTDYAPGNIIGPKSIQKPREENTHHQRTSSESLVIEDQPSWLDDLLNEPETPVRRGGHRRSSSDSFAYIDVANASNMEYAAPDEYRYKNMMFTPSWLSQDFDHHNRRDALLSSFYADANLVKQKSKAWNSSLNAVNNRAWNSSLNAVTHLNRIPSPRENTVQRGSGLSSVPQEADIVLSTAPEKQESAESAPQDAKSSTEKKDTYHAKSSPSETDTKRAKQQFAQRSRVRKLQYIAELERNVQALQAEGSEVAAELEFLNQQSLILSMENKALKQRLETLAQEQLIKYLEQEMLEKEKIRLRALYQQQQQQQNQPQQQQPSSSHQRMASRDLDSEFANLTLKHKGAVSGRDNESGLLHT